MKRIEVGFGRSVFLAAGALVCLLLLTGIAFPQAAFPKAGGIWLSAEARYKLGGARVEELTQSLRRITGFNQLHFTKDGLLVTGYAQSAGSGQSAISGHSESPGQSASSGQSEGSATARQILSCALNSGFVFVIEDHFNSPSVNFGQLNEGLRYEDAMTGVNLVVWRVRLDFKDFREVQAPREVRDSFDVGFTTLHELSHGLGYKDAVKVDELGECEERLNRARAELNLPLRDQYFGDRLRIGRHFISVRLRFRSHPPGVAAGSSRGRAQYLFFMIQSENEDSASATGAATFDCGIVR